MRTAIVIAAVALSVAACDRKDDASNGVNNTTTAKVEGAVKGAVDAATPLNDPSDHDQATNTVRNQADRDHGNMLPIDQGENKVDLAITQSIRADIVKDSAISMTGKNVKIVTLDGVVTLRGPVKSDQERKYIVSVAKHAENVKSVDSELEVATN